MFSPISLSLPRFRVNAGSIFARESIVIEVTAELFTEAFVRLKIVTAAFPPGELITTVELIIKVLVFIISASEIVFLNFFVLKH
jgi:hypothetical protein